MTQYEERVKRILWMCAALELNGVDTWAMEAAAHQIANDPNRTWRERYDDLQEIYYDAKADLRSVGLYAMVTENGFQILKEEV